MQRLYVLLCGLLLRCGGFSFGAAGDYACGQNYLDTLSKVNASGINVMVALGDLGYETAMEQWWCEQWGSRTKVNELLIVAGNHDVGENCCGDWQTYLNNCPAAAPRNGTTGVRYHIDYPLNAPLVRFIMITPGLGGSVASYSTYGAGGAGLLWLNATIDDARAQGIPWIVVGMHKNYISVLTKGDEIGAPLMNLLFAKRVDVILQAHEHGYERTKQLTCAVVNTYNPSCVAASVPSIKGLGSVIVVLGTGGQTLRTVDYGDPEWNYFASVDSSTYGFGLFEVTADRLRYNFTRSAGNTTFQDSFELNVNTTAPTSATPTTATPTGAPTTSVPSLIPTTSTPSLAPTQTPTATPSTNTPTTSTPTSTPTAAPTTPTTDTPTPISVLNAATATGGLELAALGAALVTLALLR